MRRGAGGPAALRAGDDSTAPRKAPLPAAATRGCPTAKAGDGGAESPRSVAVDVSATRTGVPRLRKSLAAAPPRGTAEAAAAPQASGVGPGGQCVRLGLAELGLDRVERCLPAPEAGGSTGAQLAG